MKMILDDQQQPQGIFIPLNEWDQVKDDVALESELYQIMNKYAPRSVFDMSAEELESNLRPFTEELVADAISNGFYVTYLANDAKAGHFINEYGDGKKESVFVDKTSGKEHIVK